MDDLFTTRKSPRQSRRLLNEESVTSVSGRNDSRLVQQIGESVLRSSDGVRNVGISDDQDSIGPDLDLGLFSSSTPSSSAITGSLFRVISSSLQTPSPPRPRP